MEWKKIGLLVVYLGVAMAAQGQWPYNVEPTDIDPAHRVCYPCSDPANNRLWFLDRLDQEGLPLDGKYSYCSDGSYYDDAGVRRQVLVYIVDTGVLRNHVEFGATDLERKARIGDGIAIVRDPTDITLTSFKRDYTHTAAMPCSTEFNASHGTAVASFIVGVNSGVAKNAFLIPVRLPCDAKGDPDEDQARAMTFAVDQIITDLNDRRASYPDQPAVVSFSAYTLPHPPKAGTPYPVNPFEEFEKELLKLVDLPGVIVLASANNQGENACGGLPVAASQGSNDPRRARIIGVGGTMIDNLPNFHPEGFGGDEVQAFYPLFNPTERTRDVRWDVGPGDSTARLSPPSDEACPSYDPLNKPQCNGKYLQTRGSNWGKCVSLWAPAWNTISATTASAFSYRDGQISIRNNRNLPESSDASGTSFAAPLAAGVAARFLSMRPRATGDMVRNALINTAVPGVIEVNTAVRSLSSDLNENIPANNNRLLQASDVMFVSETATSIAGQPRKVELEVDVAAASPIVTYQWYHGSDRGKAELSTAIGGYTPSITVSLPDGEDTAYYWVRVSGSCPKTGRPFSRDSNLIRAHACSGTVPYNVVVTPQAATFVEGGSAE